MNNYDFPSFSSSSGILPALAVAGLAIRGSDSAIVAGKAAFIAVMNGPINQALFPCLEQLFAGSGIAGVAIQAYIAFGRMHTVIENYPALLAATVQQRRRIAGAHRGSQAKQEKRHG
ncbi:MAG: hypothetical protein ABSH41_31460 [Syntrophobacteraceae bacterium]